VWGKGGEGQTGGEGAHKEEEKEWRRSESPWLGIACAGCRYRRLQHHGMGVLIGVHR